MMNYPAPFTSNNRVLGLLLSYDLNHIDPLFLITNEYVAMCESGWNVSFVLFTAANWTSKLRKYIRLKTYCYRISDYLDIRYSLHNKTVGTNLASFHRPYIAKELNNFDFFVYHEDDIIFKNTHLSAYLAETKRLYEISPEALEFSLIGFQRYRRLTKRGVVDLWSDEDIIETDLMEETPTLTPTCIKDEVNRFFWISSCMMAFVIWHLGDHLSRALSRFIYFHSFCSALDIIDLSSAAVDFHSLRSAADSCDRILQSRSLWADLFLFHHL